MLKASRLFDRFTPGKEQKCFQGGLVCEAHRLALLSLKLKDRLEPVTRVNRKKKKRRRPKRNT